MPRAGAAPRSSAAPSAPRRRRFPAGSGSTRRGRSSFQQGSRGRAWAGFLDFLWERAQGTTSTLLEVKGSMKKIEPGTFTKELGVGEVAARCGVAVSAIHFYEAKGLITS